MGGDHITKDISKVLKINLSDSENIKQSLNKKDAILNGSSDRFRPVLMTAATTVFGLLPTAIGIGEAGANTPLAIAVIGGTFMASLLTLYIIPIMYLLIAKGKNN